MIKILKKDIHAYQENKLQQIIAKKSLDIYDHLNFYKKSGVIYHHSRYIENSQVNIATLIKDFLHQKQNNNRKDLKMDEFYFHIYLFFYKNNLYAITKETADDFTKIFEKISKAKKYDYLNDPEVVSKLTSKELDSREKEWNQVFGNIDWDESRSPHSIKVEFNFPIETYFPLEDKLLIPKSILNASDRGLSLAKHIVKSRFYKSFPKSLKEKHKINKLSDFLESKSFNDQINQELSKLKPILNSSISSQELFEYKTYLLDGKRSNINDLDLIFDED